jgi:hypothetical protein
MILARTFLSIVLERTPVTGCAPIDEGALLVFKLDEATGESKVDLSAGTDSEVVAGFALCDPDENVLGVGHGKGEVFTDHYDPKVDWSTCKNIHSGAGGILTDSGGAALDARVLVAPTKDYPYLGIAFNIGELAR